MTRVVFSCPHPLDPVGPGRPLSQIHSGLSDKHGQHYVAITPVVFPELADVGRLGDARGPCFDDLAYDCLGPCFDAENSGVLVAGGGASLAQIRRVHGWPAWKAITLWFSSHAEHAQRILAQEYQRAGITQTPIHPYLVKRAIREQQASDLIVVPSEYCATTYPRDVAEKVRVAEFGVDCDEFQPGIKADGMRFFFPGSNPVRKGLLYVMDAFLNLDARPKAEMIVTGGWKPPAPLVGRPGLSVHPTGWQDDASQRRMGKSSHVYVSGSVEEGQALASLEAAASGLALIVTPETGLPIQDGQQGFVVPSRDAVAMRNAMQYFIDNPSEAERMGREARVFAETRTWRKFQDRVISLVEEAMPQ